jgi:hypothetical protein
MISTKLQVLAAIKAAQYEAIIAKGGTLSPGDWSAYAAAIEALPTGGAGVPAVIASMPFEIGDEPLTGAIWYVKPSGTGNQDGSSWDHAFATRQEAVNAASSGDQIRVWEGTYYLEQIQTPKAGVSEYYGFNGDGSWATRQPFTHPSKLDAQFTANNFENTSVTFLDEQIIDGLWAQNAVKSGNGGGLNLSVRSYLNNCVITNNSGNNGGGVYASSNSILTNCAITNCSSSSYGGGAYVYSNSILNNCVITNNRGGSNGGGAYMNGSSILNNCVVTNNSGTNGGGAYVYNGSILNNCVVTNNRGSGNGGGAYVQSSSLTNCVITNNSGGTNGGGAYVYNGSRCYNVTCAMNTATTGDNFYLTNSQSLYNCCSWGGNIWLNNANYAYKIYNCASNFALTGVTNWDFQADVQDFLTLTDFPFAAPGISPYDGSGALYHAGTIGRTDEALAFINRFIAPKMIDCHLPSGSPLIGTGYYEEGVTPETDADGATRPIPPSIGAYEP